MADLLSDESWDQIARLAMATFGPIIAAKLRAERTARKAAEAKLAEAEKEIVRLREALEWYGEQVRLSNTEAALDKTLEALGMGKDPRVSKEAIPARDAGRRALAEDNGNRARAALIQPAPTEEGEKPATTAGEPRS